MHALYGIACTHVLQSGVFLAYGTTNSGAVRGGGMLLLTRLRLLRLTAAHPVTLPPSPLCIHTGSQPPQDFLQCEICCSEVDVDATTTMDCGHG